MLDHSFAISELNRKVANIIRIGVVKEVDYEKAKVRVKIGEFITDWLPWVTARAGSWFAPNIDEQVRRYLNSGREANTRFKQRICEWYWCSKDWRYGFVWF